MKATITNDDIELAVRQRFDAAHVSVTSWRDEHGREWHGTSLMWDRHPHTGTTWTLLGCCVSRDDLLHHVGTKFALSNFTHHTPEAFQ